MLVTILQVFHQMHLNLVFVKLNCHKALDSFVKGNGNLALPHELEVLRQTSFVLDLLRSHFIYTVSHGNAI